jgi:hypothetical protein
MRAVFEMGWRQVPMLQKGAANQTAQYKTQGKAAKFIKRTLGGGCQLCIQPPKRT